MPRPIRIEFENAWYHVMNRGRSRDKIFVGNSDYQMFINLLQNTTERLKLNVVGYCLMPNHYHLVVQTPLGNLSRCMQHIDGVYTQRYNRSHGIDGALFRGRYKSILIEEDNYLLLLMRYVHQNPLKAKMVDSIEKYPWCSHQAYLSGSKKWNWLYKKYVMSKFSELKGHQIKLYSDFMSYEEQDEEIAVIDKNRWPSILGSKEFISGIKHRYLSKEHQVNDLAPSVDEIKRAVCVFYGKKQQDLMKSIHGEFNEPRNMAIYLCRRLRPDTMAEIGIHFSLPKISSVSSVVDRMNQLLKTDRSINQNAERLINKLSKRQEGV